MTIALRLAAALYRGLNRVRRALYRSGILRARRLPKPVISVGNIAAGGTGKTPAVITIARFLAGRGYRVAVLTRGYGRKGPGGLVTSGDTDRFGDEPVLIKQSTNVDVIVGVNRYDNGLRYDADVYLLDDGFQHLPLYRDIDVVIDAPAAFYREGRSALQYADIVIPRRICLEIPDALHGQALFAFAGLADNEQFFVSLREAGLRIAGTRAFPDHHVYSTAELDSIEAAARSAGAQAIVTTEKDAVKISGRDIIPIRAEFVIEPAVLERLLAAIRR